MHPLSFPTFVECEDDNELCPALADQLEYQFTVLPSNKLRVLLISDRESSVSGAYLSVEAGFFDETEDYMGLAHLCEHMLFVGTEKYPEINEFAKYITFHGGTKNAITSNEETSYYFTIQSSYLEPALDRFAQFFISPLFDTEYVQRELNAVHEEYLTHKNNEYRIRHLILKHLSNPQHPFHRFDSGNMETLNKSDVREKLLQFHQNRYSSNMVIDSVIVVVNTHCVCMSYVILRPQLKDLRTK